MKCCRSSLRIRYVSRANTGEQSWDQLLWRYGVGTYATTSKYSFKYFCQFRKSYVTKLVLKRFVKRESRRLGTPGPKDVQYLQILGMRFWERFSFTQTRRRLLQVISTNFVFFSFAHLGDGKTLGLLTNVRDYHHFRQTGVLGTRQVYWTGVLDRREPEPDLSLSLTI